MVKAIWNGIVLAECGETVVLEGNHYFPVESLRLEHFLESPTRTRCGGKGQASYYHVIVRGQVNTDAAWYYPDPKEAARGIAGRVAFWHGVQIVEER